jgi:hypothetical protein
MSDQDLPTARVRLLSPVYHWECLCREPPVVLGRYDLTGRIELDDPGRFWQINGRVATNCPKCGKPHLLDVPVNPDLLATLPMPWRGGE